MPIFLRFSAILKTNTPNRHCRRVSFWAKTVILMDCRWWWFRPDSQPPQLRGGVFSFFTLSAILGTSPRTSTSNESHFGRKCPFCGESHLRADFGLISARRNYEGFQFSHFNDLGNFGALIFRVAASEEAHFGLKKPL